MPAKFVKIALFSLVAAMTGTYQAEAVKSKSLLLNAPSSSVVANLERSRNFNDYHSISLQLDNDFFAGLDQNYTNGLRLAWLASPIASANSSWLDKKISSIFAPSETITQQRGLSLTQLMFTPATNVEYNIPKERPYAGYLAVGYANVFKSDKINNTIELQLGIIGPSALAHQAQDIWHKIIDSPLWRGWDNQLEDEPTIQFSFTQKHRWSFIERNFGKFSSDGYYFWSADAGSVYLRASMGGVARFGYNLMPVSADCTISPTNYQDPPFTGMRQPLGPWSYFGFIGTTMRVIGRDAFLDGTLFRDCPSSVSAYPVVADFNAGFGLRYKQLDVLVGYTIRTKEYTSQDRHQTIGSFTVHYRF